MTDLVLVAAGAWPWLLLLAVALLLGARWQAGAERRRRELLGARERVLAGAVAHRRARALCALAAAFAAAVVWLQPAWGLGDGEPAAPDLVVCLDASRSMAARDQAPSRFGAAVQQLERLAAGALGTRLGLVVFAGEARLAVPLTSDLPAAAAVAGTLAPGAMGRGGTDVGAAIELALLALQRGGAANGSIVLLSDGEDFAGRGAAAAAAARAAGATVHCLMLGSDAGSKIVVAAERGEVFLQDRSGDDVVTRLDRDGLQAIAAAGGGQCRAVADDAALLALHDGELVPRAVAAAVRAGVRPPAHRYQWFLLAALGFWMLRWCLPERRR